MDQKSVILALRKISKSVQIAKFYECIVDYFSPGSRSTFVEYSLMDGQLVLSQGNPQNNQKLVLLQHSDACPVKNFPDDEKQIEKIGLGVPVAVSVILESSDSFILLTQRQSHMRTSPNVWVPPGGHLDKNEDIVQCGFREVLEETGLDLSILENTTNILGLWEAVFPLALGLGPPRSHVLVIYLHTKLNLPHHILQQMLKLDPTEVQANTWLNRQSIDELMSDASSEKTITKYVLSSDGNLMKDEMLYDNMFATSLWKQHNGYYSGSQYSLMLWYNLHNNNISRL